MCPERAAPPAENRCPEIPPVSRGPKGGTIIAEEVRTLAEHEARLRAPGSYRPKSCRRCYGSRLHLHGKRERTLRAADATVFGAGVVLLILFRCGDKSCRAVWRVIPAFVARLLWRTWEVVEAAVQGTPQRAHQPIVPKSTVRRWRARLRESGRLAGQVLATSGGEALREVAQAVGLDASRRILAEAYAARFCASLLGPLSVLLHRLQPGIRLV